MFVLAKILRLSVSIACPIFDHIMIFHTILEMVIGFSVRELRHINIENIKK